jgi:hypothetical protein
MTEPHTSTTGHTFRQDTTRDIDWYLPSIYAMNRWEVDPPDWEPQWYRHQGRDCHTIHVCPGCNNWQVQYRADGLIRPSDDLFDTDTQTHFDAAVDLADEHRAHCIAFDTLAALLGAALPTA